MKKKLNALMFAISCVPLSTGYGMDHEEDGFIILENNISKNNPETVHEITVSNSWLQGPITIEKHPEDDSFIRVKGPNEEEVVVGRFDTVRITSIKGDNEKISLTCPSKSTNVFLKKASDITFKVSYNDGINLTLTNCTNVTLDAPSLPSSLKVTDLSIIGEDMRFENVEEFLKKVLDSNTSSSLGFSSILDLKGPLFTSPEFLQWIEKNQGPHTIVTIYKSHDARKSLAQHHTHKPEGDKYHSSSDEEEFS